MQICNNSDMLSGSKSWLYDHCIVIVVLFVCKYVSHYHVHTSTGIYANDTYAIYVYACKRTYTSTTCYSAIVYAYRRMYWGVQSIHIPKWHIAHPHMYKSIFVITKSDNKILFLLLCCSHICFPFGCHHNVHTSAYIRYDIRMRVCMHMQCVYTRMCVLRVYTCACVYACIFACVCSWTAHFFSDVFVKSQNT